MKRTVLSTLALLLAVGSIAIAKDHDDYAGIGQGTGFMWGGCGMSNSWILRLHKGGRCEGVLKDFPNADTITAASVITALTERGWEGRVGPVTSLASSQDGVKPRVWIESVEEASEVALAKLRDRRYVAARIIADPDGPPDKRYGIGNTGARSNARRTGVYYLVVHTYAVDTVQEFGNDTVGKSRKIAQWEVYAAESPNGSRNATNRLVRIKSSGSLRYCAHRHELDGSTPSANFWSCAVPEKAMELAKALQQDSKSRLAIAQALGESTIKATEPPSMAWVTAGVRAIVTQPGITAIDAERRQQILELARLLRDADNPVWFRCGVGCCIADT